MATIYRKRRRVMRIGLAAVALAAAVLACDRKDDVPPAQREEQARQDSARITAKALQDSGVAVDTQKIDTGTAKTTAADDN